MIPQAGPEVKEWICKLVTWPEHQYRPKSQTWLSSSVLRRVNLKLLSFESSFFVSVSDINELNASMNFRPLLTNQPQSLERPAWIKPFTNIFCEQKHLNERLNPQE